VAGDKDLVATVRALRPSLGVATPEFVQHAAEAAWNDEAHVAALREGFKAKREDALAMFAKEGRGAGFTVVPNDSTFYLWIAVPDGTTSATECNRWLEHAGVAVVPGEAMGDSGEGYLRLALVPTRGECRTALQRIARVFESRGARSAKS
jgi:aspartate/methionine/tyrosine aminotransferase